MLDSQAFIAARKARGLSQAELAATAKVSQQLIASIETGATRTTKFLLRLAVALDVPPGQLDPDWAHLARQEGATAGGGVPGSISPAGQRDLPVHSSAEGGEGFIIVTTDAVDWMPRPPPVAHVRKAYGLYITGESMVPEFEPGDIALVNPNLPVIPDTTCIFYGRGAEDEVRATIKRLRRKTGGTWYLRQWNPPEGTKADFTLSRKEWPVCHRVVGKYSRG
jgi:phage repressor protein C with HTH and peptisase S24 domain